MKHTASVIGYHTTRYGELWNKSLYELLAEAYSGAIADAHTEHGSVDAIFLGNMLGGVLDGSLLLEAHLAEGIRSHIPMYRVEAACASGGLAFQMATEYLSAHPHHTVVVVGGEKMTDVSGGEISRALATAAAPKEQRVGLTFPGVYALIAQSYLHAYGYDERHLASISVKNHAHGALNERAHFQRAITIDEVLESQYVAYPLKVLDSSPISDGASAVVLTGNATRIRTAQAAVSVLSSETATDTISLAQRERIDTLQATVCAAEKAFQTAGISRKEIDVMEVHDCFSIAEILALEDLGFWKKGEGGARALQMETARDAGNNLIVNTSGGLKAAGHPVGGTGIKQIGEIYLQLTGRAGKRQVARHAKGLAHNVGGSGGVAVVTLLGIS